MYVYIYICVCVYTYMRIDSPAISGCEFITLIKARPRSVILSDMLTATFAHHIAPRLYVCMYVCMYVCACLRVCENMSVCLSMCAYINMHIHTHTHTHFYTWYICMCFSQHMRPQAHETYRKERRASSPSSPAKLRAKSADTFTPIIFVSVSLTESESEPSTPSSSPSLSNDGYASSRSAWSSATWKCIYTHVHAYI